MTQSKKYAIVTGVSQGGIGFFVVRDLARQGYHVTVASRNASKTQQAIDVLVKEHDVDQSMLQFIQIDTSDLVSVQKFVQQYQQAGHPLQLLVLNAGIYKGPRSAQGFDGAFACMYLGHWYLTQQLMPLMIESQPARVIWVASMMHRLGRLDYKNFAYDQRFTSYSDVKLAMILAARQWHQKTHGEGVSHIALHPGAVASTMYSNTSGYDLSTIINWLGKVMFITPQESSQVVTFAATKQRVDMADAVYLNPHSPAFSWSPGFMTEALSGRFRQHPSPVNPSKNALNDEVGEELFDWTEQKLEDAGFGNDSQPSAKSRQ